MSKFYTLRLCLALATLFVASNTMYAQEITWNNTPQKGFVFQITNAEAQKLLIQTYSDAIFNGLLHTPVDTFDIKTGWTDRPTQGHFILATVVANKLHCEYTSVFPYQVFLLKEYDALSLQVLDFDGTVREDARVKLKSRRIRIDRETKTYRVQNDWFLGDSRYVTVELDGFRSVFNVQKHEVPTWYDDYYSSDEGPTFYSYMITDKNKYKPNEKVRFKSYALSQARMQLRKDLEIWLIDRGKTIKLGEVQPHRPGSYASEFTLHDSLKLILDKSYELRLQEKKGRIVSSCHFKYEDYELTGNKLELKLTTPKQFHPADNKLIISATDANGLVLKDATAGILVRTRAIRETFQPLAILPDTLMYIETRLNGDSATVVSIPSSLFQKTNTAYEVHVTVLNSQNQRMEQVVGAEHYYSQYELVTRFSNDSIVYEVLNNGAPMPDLITMHMFKNGEREPTKIVMPFKEKINPAISAVRITGNLLTREITMRNLIPKLEIVGGIRKDSFQLALINPQQLDVSWYVYQGSVLLQKGFGKTLDHASLITDRSQTYYIELLYSFGGQEQIKRREYEFKEEFLDVTLDVPERVYPGQQVEATIQVNNQLGNPVSGVDLTAVATTAKLNYYLPSLPYYGSSSTPRSAKAHYSKNEINQRNAILNLDYKNWVKRLRLDTMKYYQFTYPNAKGFTYTIAITDSTQFAPFVMQGGVAKEIYVIEVNRKPVYYSWVDQPKANAIYVSPGKHHQVTLRLHDRVLVLDSIVFAAGKKTILSFDLDDLPKDVQTITMNYVTEKVGYKKAIRKYYAFTKTEQDRHIQYVSAFNVTDGYAYLQSGKEFTPLFSGQFRSFKTQILVGPVNPTKQIFTGNYTNISYQHTGGYQYAFEDNVVYKLTAEKLLPERLENRSFDPLKRVNDRVETKRNFLEYKYSPDSKWLTRVIDLADHSLRMSVLLPEEKAASGIAALLFEDCRTKKIVSTCNDHQSNKMGLNNIPRGCVNAIILYNNGTYLKMDVIALKSNTQIMVDLKESTIHAADSLSQKWLSMPLGSNCYGYTPTPQKSLMLRHSTSSAGNVRGNIYDNTNMTIPGASIIVKGTSIGTMSDGDGQFSLDIDETTATLVISFIGYQTKEIEVQIGTNITVYLMEDVNQLSEVVVVGYGSQLKSELTSSISSVLAGRVAGVAISDLQDDEVISPPQKAEEVKEAERQLYQELLMLNGLRSNFHDVAIWEPRLFTDKRGQSKFTVTFPDDITRWDATVYAMNRMLQTGTTRKSIRSYKPIMAELSVPQFLTKGDSAYFIGKVLNYSEDKNISGTVSWNGAGKDRNNKIQLTDFFSDTFSVIPSTTDSLTTRYIFTRDDGYKDGEERTIAVLEQGSLRADGTLALLNNHEDVTIRASATETITVEILNNQLDIYAGEIQQLVNYKYACNEQLASKLLGLIGYRAVMQYQGKPFRNDKDVNKIIARLLKNQNDEFLWSWWDVSPNTSYWMSAHILRALKTARDAGYEVNLQVDNIARKAAYKFEFLHEYSLQDIELINALASWGAKLSYAKHTHALDSILLRHQLEINPRTGKHRNPYSFLKEKLLLLETRQLMNVGYQQDSLLRYQKKGILDEVYFSDNKPARYWYNDDLSANAIAYRIIRKDSSLQALRTAMQLYFIGLRKNQAWNTYHASAITASLLPDLIEQGAKRQAATVTISGGVNETVSKFPYSVNIPPNETITLRKELGLPMYYMNYTEERVTEAKTGVEGFRIKTFFSTNNKVLQAGKPVALTVEIDVTKTADQEYVMIEVPIPASCSYADKRQNDNRIETHREYFKDRTVIFCENMKPGKYAFNIYLLPRFTGSYIVNPAQVSLMYIPVVNANTDMIRVNVK